MIPEYIRHLGWVWRVNNYGEAVAFAFAISIFIFGLWPIRLPLAVVTPSPTGEAFNQITSTIAARLLGGQLWRPY